jgi:GxxExxY protein
MHPKYPKAEEVIHDVHDAAEEVLKIVGPGLLEVIYEQCLSRELELRGHRVEKEKRVTVCYKGHEFIHLLRADLIVDECVVIELKSVEGNIRPEFRLQLLSYMKLLDVPLGLVINFGATSATRYRRVILAGADVGYEPPF